MQMEIYSRRWGHTDKVTIEKTESGWKITHINKVFSGECDKQCNPYLEKILKQENINYPADLGGYLEYLWDNYDELGEERTQEELNILVEWMNQMEMNSPKSDFWKIYS